MNEASLASLMEHIVDNRGKTCPTADSGMPLIATNCVKSENLYPTFEKVRFVDNKTYSSWFRSHPKPGDLIFVLKGSPGEVCLTPDPVSFCIAQDMVALRPDPQKIYPPYLFAALRSDRIKADISNLHVGTMIPHFKKGDFDRLLIPIPEEKRQVEIGDAYLNISRKIELNRRMNETLEEMARALFRDWFVDFGPTRRQMEGATDPTTIMGNTFPADKADAFASLFPAKFGENGLPEGWVLGGVSNLANLNPNAWTAKKHPEQVEYVDLSNTKWGRIEDITVYSWSDAPSRARRVLEVNDTIIGTVRPGNGSYALIGQRDLTGSTGFAVLRPKHAVSTEFIYLALTSPDNINNLANLADGGAYPAINPKIVAETKLVLPGSAVIKHFSQVTKPLFAKRHANERESQTLAEIRDLLLPKLMSGEIRLKVVEAML